MAAAIFSMFPWLVMATLVGYFFGYRDGKGSRR